MSQYWKDREAENLKRNKLTEEQYKAEVEKIYNRMLRDIQREIDSFYGRYADKEGISIAEAKKRVSKLDMDDYERKAKQYVKDRDFSDLANDEMRLYNLTMKVNRLEMLKSRIGLELIAGHDDLEKFMEEILKGRTIEELERQAGILGDSVLNAANLDKMVSSIVNASFHNANFSQRIWTNEAVMKTELDKLLKQGLIQGKGARELARSLRTLCGVSQRNAERLMITELARVQIEAQKLSYEETDFEEYEYIAEPTACPVCKVMDGKHFKVAKMLPGENAAPMHPHCRCSTAPYSDRKDFDEWLNHLEKGGTAEEWDRLKSKDNTIEKKPHRTEKSDMSQPIEVKAVAKSHKSDKIEDTEDKKSINDDDLKAINDYISAKSYIINEKLRNGDELLDDEQDFISDFDAVLKKLPKFSGDLQRSLYFNSNDDVMEFLNDYTKGAMITYKEYISTTKGETYNPDGQVQIYIENAQKGVDISSYNKDEHEVLYDRGSSFEVVNVVNTDDKYYILLKERENE